MTKTDIQVMAEQVEELVLKMDELQVLSILNATTDGAAGLSRADEWRSVTGNIHGAQVLVRSALRTLNRMKVN